MSHIIPFEQNKLPAHIAARFQVTGPSALSQNVGTSYPIVSIKGKVFHLVRGDERTLITRPGEDEPAGSIDVVIMAANPNLSKTYYPNGFEEGAAEKPTCYSNDGIAPGADAAEPQSSKCATCPHNQFGSRITESGGKGKACSDFRRMAISTANAPDEAMLIRVPAASLKPLAQYGDMLMKRGVDFSAVVTKIGFDHTVAFPSLTFKAVGFIDEATAAAVDEARQGEHIKAVIGLAGTTYPAASEDAPAPAAKAPAPKPAAKAAAKPASKPATARADAAAEAAAEAGLNAATAAAAAAPGAPARVVIESEAPAPAMVVDSKAAADIGSMLAGISFDD